MTLGGSWNIVLVIFWNDLELCKKCETIDFLGRVPDFSKSRESMGNTSEMGFGGPGRVERGRCEAEWVCGTC